MVDQCIELGWHSTHASDCLINHWTLSSVVLFPIDKGWFIARVISLKTSYVFIGCKILF
jgi:hypothetical protein